MKGEWCYFKNYFSPKECEIITNLCSKVQKQNGFTGGDNHIYENLDLKTADNSLYRKSKIAWLTKENGFEGLIDTFWSLAIKANEEWFGFHIDKLDMIQFTEYSSEYGGYYKKHHDVFWINNENKHRKLSCVVQLSDPKTYEGGSLELFSGEPIPANDIRSQGTVFFFPSFLEHQVSPVTKGIRHSLVAWFQGPKWR